MLISVERPLGIDSPGQMVASILSKKIAAGSTHLVLDIPIGPSAKVRCMAQAQRLRRLFEYVASRMGLSLEVVITDGRQPIGQGIGPVLEARDVMRVLHNDPLAPTDLREKSLRLAGRMIECDPAVRGGQGLEIAREILASGRALRAHERHHRRPGRHRLRLPAAATGRTQLRGAGARSGRGHAASTTCIWPTSQAWPVPPRSRLPASTCCASWARPWPRAMCCTGSMPASRPTWSSHASAVESASGYTIGAAQDVPQVSVEF